MWYFWVENFNFKGAHLEKSTLTKRWKKSSGITDILKQPLNWIIGYVAHPEFPGWEGGLIPKNLVNSR